MNTKKLNELHEEIMKYPDWEDKYVELRREIEKELAKKPNHHDYVICFPTVNWHTEDNIQIKKIRNHSVKCPGVLKASEVILFKNNNTFVGAGFEIRKRLELEYNINYKQLVVGALITSGDKVLCLKSLTGRLEDKLTMVQGHVDYHASVLVKSQISFLRDNVLRELNEELFTGSMTKKYFEDNAKIGYYISSNEDYISMEHFGTIFTIDVKDMELTECNNIKLRTEDNEILDVLSGEPDKHDLFVIENKEHYEELVIEGKLDGWLKLILAKHYEGINK